MKPRNQHQPPNPFQTAPAVLSVDEISLQTAFSAVGGESNPGWTLVVFSGDALGKNDMDHGSSLLLSFLAALCDKSIMPDELVFYHTGVLLLSEDHPAAESIRKLSSMDVQLLACGESCLEYRVDPSHVKVTAVEMSVIAGHMMNADKVIHP